MTTRPQPHVKTYYLRLACALASAPSPPPPRRVATTYLMTGLTGLYPEYSVFARMSSSSMSGRPLMSSSSSGSLKMLMRWRGTWQAGGGRGHHTSSNSKN